ncbi:MAG: ParB/RepB/Spo0J family partition protein [Dehalococcoidia bacterium]|nr:ParB/RepB/Spo0J family partition protein [Dehalococcoidia bacterium]
MARKGGLGRGLSALIPEMERPRDERVPSSEVPIGDIVPNPQQPRTSIDPARLEELAASIRTFGVIQPLLVTEERAVDGRVVYQLIAGERRLRAAKAAGLEMVPVTIRQTTPQELLEIAIVENVQRADLNPIEEALAYQRLIGEFSLTQRDVAERVGRSRAAVANTLRLTELPADVRASIMNGEISEGHGRALLGLPSEAERLAAWRAVVARELNVRETERMVREGVTPKPKRTAPEPQLGPLAITQGFEAALERSLGTKVALKRTQKGRGTLTIHFYSDEELTGVLERILGEDAL